MTEAPRLFAVPNEDGSDSDQEAQRPEGPGPPVSLDKDSEPRAELAIPEPSALDEILEGEVVRYRQPIKRRPIFAAWLIDPVERDAARRWAVAYYGHELAFQSARAPKYVARTIAWSPRGLGRAGWWWARWCFDREGGPLRAQAVEKGDIDGYLKLSRQRNDRVKARLQTSAGVATGALVAAGAALWVWPPAQYPLILTLVMLLGYVGRPVGRPFVEQAVITASAAPKLTPSVVVRALGSLGLAEVNKALAAGGEGVTFACDPCRDGPGWRADVDLPYGVTVTAIMERREKLASGLRRNLGCVWPEGDPEEHAGRMILWVGDKPLRQLKMPAWPLLREGSADIFQALPLGVDVRGRPVNVTLMFQNLLVGAMPRQGKTFSVRVLLLGAALDPIVQLRIFELKGTGDLAPLKKVSHHYASGIIDPAIEAALRSLEDLDNELERRSELIKRIAEKYPHRCPENKITRALAEDPEFDLAPILCAIDEAQNLFAHPEFGERAAELAERVIKVGPALGIMLVLATQKPNSKSLPTGVRSNVAMRMALRVADQDTNDMILGTGQYKRGNNAMMFSRNDLGIGLLLGEADDVQIVRTFYIDNPAADIITGRALELRTAAGTLTGVAGGQTKAIAPTKGLPEHLAQAWPAGESAVWLETLLPVLARDNPELYGEWSTTDLGHACRADGIDRKDIGRGSGAGKATRRGITREALDRVLQRRQKAL